MSFLPSSLSTSKLGSGDEPGGSSEARVGQEGTSWLRRARTSGDWSWREAASFAVGRAEVDATVRGGREGVGAGAVGGFGIMNVRWRDSVSRGRFFLMGSPSDGAVVF